MCISSSFIKIRKCTSNHIRCLVGQKNVTNVLGKRFVDGKSKWRRFGFRVKKKSQYLYFIRRWTLLSLFVVRSRSSLVRCTFRWTFAGSIFLPNRVDWFLDHPVYSSYFWDSRKFYLFFAKAIRLLCCCFREDEGTDNYVMFELLQPWYWRVEWPYLKRDSVKRWTVRTMQLTLNRYESTSNEIAAAAVVRVPSAVSSYCSRFCEQHRKILSRVPVAFSGETDAR